jgi:hypothetical protein
LGANDDGARSSKPTVADAVVAPPVAPAKAKTSPAASKKASKSPAKAKPKQSKDAPPQDSVKSSPLSADGNTSRSSNGSNGSNANGADEGGKVPQNGASAAVSDEGAYDPSPRPSGSPPPSSLSDDTREAQERDEGSDGAADSSTGVGQESPGGDGAGASARDAGATMPSPVAPTADRITGDGKSPARRASPDAAAADAADAVVVDATNADAPAETSARPRDEQSSEQQSRGASADVASAQESTGAADRPELPHESAEAAKAVGDSGGAAADVNVGGAIAQGSVATEGTVDGVGAAPAQLEQPQATVRPPAKSPAPAVPSAGEIADLDDVAASYARKLAHVSMVLAAREEKVLQLVNELDGKNETHAVRGTPHPCCPAFFVHEQHVLAFL